MNSKIFDDLDQHINYYQRPARKGDDSALNIFGDSVKASSINLDRSIIIDRPYEFSNEINDTNMTSPKIDDQNIKNDPIIADNDNINSDHMEQVGKEELIDSKGTEGKFEEGDPHEGIDSFTSMTSSKYVNRGGAASETNYIKNQRGMYNPITGEGYD
ncbi:unnamed protein product [Gordionus sp. m RMFG-2023]|uniref:uncharacterized protein LOC135927270 n=1 Tax=Gordionus sp. m RMFG-2023 TaxID=3053472 RepID=UPI0030E0FE01